MSMPTILFPTPSDGQSGHGYLWAFILAALLITALRVAYLACSFHPLYGDEAQYWDYGRDLAFGYYSKPPVIAWLTRASTELFGVSEFAVRLPMPLLHAGTATGLYALGTHLFGARIGFWGGLVYLTLPGVSLSAQLNSTDPPMMLFWAWALYALARALENGRRLTWAIAGALLGLSLLSKYTAVAFVLSLVILLWRDRDMRAIGRSAGPKLFALAAVIVFSPNLFWNAQHGFASILHVGENADITSNQVINPDEFGDFFGAQFGVFGPILFLVLLVMLAQTRKLSSDARYALLLSFSWPLLLIICVQALLSKANANWAAPVYLSASVAVSAWLIESGRMLWLRVSLVLHIIAFIAMNSFQPILDARGVEYLPRKLDPVRKLRGWRDFGEEIKALRAEHPGAFLLFDDRKAMAEALFYADATLDDAIMWDPDGRPNNHYELLTDLEDARGQPVLLIARRGLDGPSERFNQRTDLPPIEIRTHRDRVEVWQVALLRDLR